MDRVKFANIPCPLTYRQINQTVLVSHGGMELLENRVSIFHDADLDGHIFIDQQVIVGIPDDTLVAQKIRGLAEGQSGEKEKEEK